MKLYEIKNECFQAYSKNIDKAREGFDLADFVNQREEAELIGNIGHVYVSGILLSDSTKIDRDLGATDYKDISHDISEMLEAGALGIVLHVNSGGGMVMGCIEAARDIERCPVPVVTHIEGMGCSGAYKLASASSYIVATESSEVGNIGSILVYTDTSGMMENLGLRTIPFVNDGAIYKAIGHANSLTEAQTLYLQESINQSGKAFQDFVWSNRPQVDEVCFTAAWFNGQAAVDVGLIDEVGSELTAILRCEELIQALSV